MYILVPRVHTDGKGAFFTMQKLPMWSVGILLALAGAGLLKWSPDQSLRHSLGEATVIAGVLSLAVDPLLKRSLLKEASQGIFHHLVGFDQQPEIKDRLKELVFKTILFRKDFRITCTILPLSENKVRLNVSHTGELVNPSNYPQEFRQYLALEKSVNPTISGISLLSSEVKYETATLSEKAEEPGVLECAGPRVWIKPSKAGIRYYVSAQYTFEFPDHFYYTLHFGHPTIGVLLSMNAPPDFIVSASPTPVSDGHSWEYQKLFMTQEYLTVRWRRDGVQSAETGPSLGHS